MVDMSSNCTLYESVLVFKCLKIGRLAVMTFQGEPKQRTDAMNIIKLPSNCKPNWNTFMIGMAGSGDPAIINVKTDGYVILYHMANYPTGDTRIYFDGTFYTQI